MADQYKNGIEAARRRMIWTCEVKRMRRENTNAWIACGIVEILTRILDSRCLTFRRLVSASWLLGEKTAGIVVLRWVMALHRSRSNGGVAMAKFGI